MRRSRPLDDGRAKPLAVRRVPAIRTRLADAAGSASLELLTLGVLLLVPLAYLALSLASIQAAALCAEGAARHAGRILADDGASDAAQRQAEAAIAFAVADHGLDPDQVEVGIGCLPAGERCTSRSLISVEVTVLAPLPLVPDALDPSGRAALPITASSAFPMGRFDGGVG